MGAASPYKSLATVARVAGSTLVGPKNVPKLASFANWLVGATGEREMALCSAVATSAAAVSNTAAGCAGCPSAAGRALLPTRKPAGTTAVLPLATVNATEPLAPEPGV